jgi:Family of unknown function (DUF6263)
MKKILLTSLCFVTINLFAQNIKIAIGKKITSKSSSTIDMDMGMGGQMKMTNKTTSVIDIIAADEKNYKATNTVTKIVTSNEMMGQETTFDSDKKEDIESENGKVAGKNLNKKVNLEIDKNTGKAKELESNSKSVEPLTEDENPFASFMGNGDKIAENNTSAAFFIIPTDKKVGDKWIENTEIQGLKAVKNYEYKSLIDGIAILNLKTIGKGTISKETKGMQFELEMETTGDATLTIDTKMGLVKKNAAIIDVSGTMNAMGQSIPITIKSNTLIEFE